MNELRGLWLLGGAFWLLPARVLACPACVDPRAPNSEAFLTGTILLSLLPIAMFVGMVLFLRHRARIVSASESALQPRQLEGYDRSKA